MNKNQKAILALALMAAMVIGAFAVVGDSADAVVGATGETVTEGNVAEAMQAFKNTYYNKELSTIQDGYNGYINVGAFSESVSNVPDMHTSVGKNYFVDFPAYTVVDGNLYVFVPYLMFESDGGSITIEGKTITVPGTTGTLPLGVSAQNAARGDAWIDGKDVSFVNYGTKTTDYLSIQFHSDDYIFFTEKIYSNGVKAYGFTSEEHTGQGDLAFYPSGYYTDLDKKSYNNELTYKIITINGEYCELNVHSAAAYDKYDAYSAYNALPSDVDIASVTIAGHTTYYPTLRAAWDFAASQDLSSTILLLDDYRGAGMKTVQGKGADITLDLGGKTFTCIGPAVGSTGTETQIFQLLQGNTVKIQNGTIAAEPGKGIKMFIQNYCDLTLDDVNMTGIEGVSYVLSNNNGFVTITGKTNIAAYGTKYAFDVYYWPSNGYTGGVTVTFDRNFTGTVDGKFQCGSDETTTNPNMGKLIIEAGKFTGLLEHYDATTTSVSISGGCFDVTVPVPYLAEGYVDVDGHAYGVDAKYLVIPAVAKVTVGAEVTYYPTLEAAWIYATSCAESTVELLSDAEGAGLAIWSKDNGGKNVDVTLDLGGFTYKCITAVGSTNTVTQAFHLERYTAEKNNTVKICNGTITSKLFKESNIKMLVQNYADLTLENVVLDGSNISPYQYVSSNNNGTILIKDSVINALGMFAFDVYSFGSYTGTTVTIENSQINGDMEIGRENTSDISLTLILKSGTFNGKFGFSGNGYEANVMKVTKSEDVKIAAPEGFYWADGTTLAEGAVVMGTQSYGTIMDAVRAIGEGMSGTIILNTDMFEDVKISDRKNVTIDLNGKTLTNVAGDTIYVEKGSTLSIVGTGTVDNVLTGFADVFNNGTVTIDGPTFTRSQEINGKTYYNILNHGSMVFIDGTVDNEVGGFSSLIANGYYDYNGVENTGERYEYLPTFGMEYPVLTINGGTFIGGLNTVKNDDAATLVINGGTFSNTVQHVILNHNVATINSGTFTMSNSGYYAVYDCGCDGTIDKGTLTINGGTFTGGVLIHNNLNINKGSDSNLNSEVTITGGTFNGELKVGYYKSIEVTGGSFSDLSYINYLVDSDKAYTVTINGSGSIDSDVTIHEKAKVILNGNVTVNAKLTVIGKLTVNGTINSPVSNFVGSTGRIVLSAGSAWNNGVEKIVGPDAPIQIVNGNIILYNYNKPIYNESKEVVGYVPTLYAEVDGAAKIVQTIDIGSNVIRLAEGSTLTLAGSGTDITFTGTVRGPDSESGEENVISFSGFRLKTDMTLVGGSLYINGVKQEDSSGSITIEAGQDVNITGTLNAGVTLNISKDATVKFSDFTQTTGSEIYFEKSDGSITTDITEVSNYSVGQNTNLSSLPFTVSGVDGSKVTYNGKNQSVSSPSLSAKTGYNITKYEIKEGSVEEAKETGAYHAIWTVSYWYKNSADEKVSATIDLDFVWYIEQLALDETGKEAEITVGGGLTYNGEDLTSGITVTVTKEIAGADVTLVRGTDYTVTFYKDAELTIETPVIDVGIYYVKVTAVENGNFKSFVSDWFNISKMPVTITPSPATKVYGTSDPVFEATSFPALPTGFTIHATFSRDSGEEVVNHPVIRIDTCVIKDALGVDVTDNFNIDATGTALLTITKAASDYSAEPSPKTGLVYNGSQQALMNAGSADGGTVMYSVNGGAWTIDVPTMKDARSYDVKYKIVGDSNHNDLAERVVTVTIEQYTASIDWSGTEFTYDGLEHAPVATVSNLFSGDTCAVTVTGAQKGAGEYTAKVSVGGLGNGNYKLVSEATQDFIINPRVAVISWSSTPLTYNGSYQAPVATVSNLVGGDTCEVTVTGAVKDAGTGYTATVSAVGGLGNENYKLDSDATTTFSISAKVVGLEWTNTSQSYTGFALLPTATATGLIGSDVCSVTVVIDGGDAVDVGNYTARATALGNSNYALPAEVTTGFVVTKAVYESEVSLDKNVWTYGEDAAEFNVTERRESAIVTYTVKDSSGTVVDSWKNAGTYTVFATIGETTNYGKIVTTEKSFTINKKELTVTWSDTELTYNTNEQKPTATLNSAEFVYGETPTVTVTGAQTNAGTYNGENAAKAVLDEGFTGNYVLKAGTETKDFEIKQATFTPHVSIDDWAYGGTASSPAVTDNTSGGEVTYLYTGDEYRSENAPVNAGNYTLTITIAATQNYQEATASDTFTINKKELTVTWSNIELTYNGSEQKPTASLNSAEFVNEDGPSVTVSGEQINAGAYSGEKAAKAVLDEASQANYVIKAATEKTNFTIAKLTISNANIKLDYTQVDSDVYAEFSFQNLAVDPEHHTFVCGSALTDDMMKVEAGKEYTVTLTISSPDDVNFSSSVSYEFKAEYSYTVTFMSKTVMDGDFVIDQVASFALKQSIILPKVNNLPSGKVALGWSTSQDGSTPTMKEGSYYNITNLEVKLYAVYGGATSETYYTITKGTMSNGGAEMVDKLVPGQLLFIFAQPADGYYAKSVKIAYSAENVVEADPWSSGIFVIQPSGSCTVTVEFAKLETSASMLVYVSQIDYDGVGVQVVSYDDKVIPDGKVSVSYTYAYKMTINDRPTTVTGTKTIDAVDLASSSSTTSGESIMFSDPNVMVDGVLMTDETLKDTCKGTNITYIWASFSYKSEAHTITITSNKTIWNACESAPAESS